MFYFNPCSPVFFPYTSNSLLQCTWLRFRPPTFSSLKCFVTYVVIPKRPFLKASKVNLSIEPSSH